MRNTSYVRPYSRPIPVVVLEGWLFLMSEVPLCSRYVRTALEEARKDAEVPRAYTHLGPYRRTMLTVLRWSKGGAISYERGIHVRNSACVCILFLLHYSLGTGPRWLLSLYTHSTTRSREHRVTSLIRHPPLLGPYSRTTPRDLWWF